MKIIVKAKTRAKEEGVERVEQTSMDFTLSDLGEGESNKWEMEIYKVSVKEAPVAGKANEAIIKALAVYFDIAPTRVHLVSGQTSTQKIFEID